MLTVKDMREGIDGWSDDAEIHFEGLTFYRFKRRGDRLLQIEFNEPASPTVAAGDDDGALSSAQHKRIDDWIRKILARVRAGTTSEDQARNAIMHMVQALDVRNMGEAPPEWLPDDDPG